MEPNSVSRQCLKNYFNRLKNELPCNTKMNQCIEGKSALEKCGLWDLMTQQEKNDAGVLWRVSYSTDYPSVKLMPGDMERYNQIVNKVK